MTAWVRSRRPSLLSNRLTWVLTVSSVITRRFAISMFERPSATSWSTSVSRLVNDAEGRRERLGRSPLRDELADQPARDLGGKECLAGGDDANGIEQSLRGAVFEQEPAGSGAQGVVDVLVQIERRQDEDARAPLRRVLRAGESPRCRPFPACARP